MEKLFQLASDIAKLWSNYGVSHYLPGHCPVGSKL